MTSTRKAPPPYPKSHILAASGIAALLSLALLVFPSREVEAKKTYLNLELDADAEQIQQQSDEPTPIELNEQRNSTPFAKIDNGSAAAQATSSDADTSELVDATAQPAGEHIIRVSSGDTLSTIFAKVGLSATTLHSVLNSSKDAKQFSQLKIGQELQFRLDQDGNLENLSSQLNDLESISLTRKDNGFAFKRDLVKPEVRTAYAHGVINSSLFLSAKRAGLPHGLTMDLANIFGYDIDFALDIRDGDEFELIYEEKSSRASKSVPATSSLPASPIAARPLLPFAIPTSRAAAATTAPTARACARPSSALRSTSPASVLASPTAAGTRS